MDLVITFPFLRALCSQPMMWHGQQPHAESKQPAVQPIEVLQVRCGMWEQKPESPPGTGSRALPIPALRAGFGHGVQLESRQHLTPPPGCQTWAAFRHLDVKKVPFLTAEQMFEDKLPHCDQLQICLASFMSGRANGIRATCGRSSPGGCAGNVLCSLWKPCTYREPETKTAFWCLAFLSCLL